MKLGYYIYWILIIIAVLVGLSSGSNPETPPELEYTLVLSTDDDIYDRGDTMEIYGYLFYGTDPMDSQAIEVWINYSGDVWEEELLTDADGYFTTTHLIGNPAYMSYAVQARLPGTDAYNHTFFTLLPDGSGTLTG